MLSALPSIKRNIKLAEKDPKCRAGFDFERCVTGSARSVELSIPTLSR